MKINNSNQGFSLIETMVNVTIFSLLTLSIMSFFSWAITSYQKLQAMDRVVKNADRALSTMVYEIREAQEIYYPTSTSTQISLKTYHNLPEGEDFTYIDIYLCGTGVCVKREGEAAENLTSSEVEVTDLRFTQIATSSAASVYINLSVQNAGYAETRSDNYSVDIHSAATLRSL